MLPHIQFWKKLRDHSKFFLKQLYVYGSHSIPVTVEFQYRQTWFYLMRYWLSEDLNQILFNEEKYKKNSAVVIPILLQ